MLADSYQIMVAPDADTCQTMVRHQLLTHGMKLWGHEILAYVRLVAHNVDPYQIMVAPDEELLVYQTRCQPILHWWWWFTSDYGDTKCWSISNYQKFIPVSFQFKTHSCMFSSRWVFQVNIGYKISIYNPISRTYKQILGWYCFYDNHDMISVNRKRKDSMKTEMAKMFH